MPLRGSLLSMMLLTAACATSDKRLQIRSEPDLSLVFLYLDMKAAATGVGEVRFRQLDALGEHVLWTFRVHEGVVFMEGLPRGKYALDSFTSKGDWYYLSQPVRFSVPEEGSPIRFVVSTPGIQYAGAFIYRDAGKGRFSPSNFSIEPLQGISERGVLERILPLVQGTSWEDRVQSHLRTLAPSAAQKR